MTHVRRCSRKSFFRKVSQNSLARVASAQKCKDSGTEGSGSGNMLLYPWRCTLRSSGYCSVWCQVSRRSYSWINIMFKYWVVTVLCGIVFANNFTGKLSKFFLSRRQFNNINMLNDSTMTECYENISSDGFKRKYFNENKYQNLTVQ